MIWFNKKLTIDEVKQMGKGFMGDHIGIEFTEINDNNLQARMPVDYRTRQPYGLLHGGASCVLAETIGSIGSALVIDQSKFICVGLEINANHLRSVKDGLVTGIATPIHLGSLTHVWDIRIIDQNKKLLCISRLTVAILERKNQPDH